MTRFIVYRQVYEGDHLPYRYLGDGPATRVALRAFADRAAAEACVRELLQAARRRSNPFATLNRLAEEQGEYIFTGGYDDQHDVAALKRLLALGVPFVVAPEAGWPDARWDDWYEAEAPHLTDADRAKVWSLFDARPLYGVAEVPFEE